MNSENKLEQQNKRKQTYMGYSQKVRRRWGIFLIDKNDISLCKLVNIFQF